MFVLVVVFRFPGLPSHVPRRINLLIGIGVQSVESRSKTKGREEQMRRRFLL